MACRRSIRFAPRSSKAMSFIREVPFATAITSRFAYARCTASRGISCRWTSRLRNRTTLRLRLPRYPPHGLFEPGEVDGLDQVFDEAGVHGLADVLFVAVAAEGDAAEA